MTAGTTKARLAGRRDAHAFLDETPRSEWADTIRPGTLGADEGLVNALDTKDLEALLGPRAYRNGKMTRAMSRALREYAAAWANTVRRAIRKENQ